MINLPASELPIQIKEPSDYDSCKNFHLSLKFTVANCVISAINQMTLKPHASVSWSKRPADFLIFQVISLFPEAPEAEFCSSTEGYYQTVVNIIRAA